MNVLEEFSWIRGKTNDLLWSSIDLWGHTYLNEIFAYL